MRLVMDTYRTIVKTIKRSDLIQLKVLFCYRGVGWWSVLLALFNWYRRPSKDYECLPETSVAMIQVAMIRIMLRRLA